MIHGLIVKDPSHSYNKTLYHHSDLEAGILRFKKKIHNNALRS